ncbi:MAG TPA: hypothetical protein VKY74_00765, partial [Chloroflexia bacterium]|nr:hypothetical protein [Chloroflexia bacterium]
MMPLLHAVWVPRRGRTGGALLLWGEHPDARPAPARAADVAPVAPHPRAAGEADLRAALAQLAAAAHLTPTLEGAAIWFPTVPLWLPATSTGGPQPSWAGAADLPDEETPPSPPFPRRGGAGGEVAVTVGALAVPALPALGLLLRLPGAGRPPVGGSLRFWGAAARLVAAMLAGGRYLPAFVVDEDGEWATWAPAWNDPRDSAGRARLAAAMPGAAGAATPGLAPAELLASFCDTLVAAAVPQWGRGAALPPPPRPGVPPGGQAAYEWM